MERTPLGGGTFDMADQLLWILMPLIICRILDGGVYDDEMLSGHNRMNAGQIAGLDGAWCLIKEGLPDAEALPVGQ